MIKKEQKTSEQVNDWMSEWANEWMDELLSEWVNKRTNEQINMDGWIKQRHYLLPILLRMNVWMDKWMNE